MDHATDEYLVKQSLQGNRIAFGELITRYQVQVYHFSRRLLGNEVTAQDITQDVFVKAFLALDTWQPTAAFAAWLLRIARNACLDMLRIQQRRPTLSLDDYTEPLIANTPSMEEQTIQTQRLQMLENALLELSLDHREIIILRDIEEFSYQDIADFLDINVGTVRSRLSRARAALTHIVTSRSAYD